VLLRRGATMNQQIIHIINNDTDETFQIVGLENFIEWLNDNDPVFSFSLDNNSIIDRFKAMGWIPPTEQKGKK
jgi:hypothetical protein